MKRSLLLAALSLSWSAQAAAAPGPTDESRIAALEALVEQLRVQIQAQESKIASLQGAAQPGSTAPRAAPTAPPVKSMLPDIGFVADIVAASTNSTTDEEGNDRLSVREIELILGHDIDPYSRLDAVITFSDFEDPDIEEAKVTYRDLPLGSIGKVGRFRQRVGKATAQHRDALDTVDEPLVVQRYLGVEGLFRTGVELSAFTPLSADAFTQELIIGGMEGGVGEDGELFGETRRRPSSYAHAAHFVELSSDSNFELGGSYLLGSQDEDAGNEVQAFGIDATLVHYVTPRNKFKLQGEIYLQSRDETFGSDGSAQVYQDDPYGYYILADYRLADRWGIGARFDYVEPTLLEESVERNADTAYSAIATFHQSEFARWRFQYQRAELADGTADDRFFLQGTFSIGKHQHAIQ